MASLRTKRSAWGLAVALVASVAALVIIVSSSVEKDVRIRRRSRPVDARVVELVGHLRRGRNSQELGIDFLS
jgi:hypothetical protein